jgi:GTP-binding protein
MKGKNGSHLLVRVPNRTVFKNKLGEVVFEMNTENNAKMVLARGGAGGKGNYYFLSNENRMPQQFEAGHKGENFEYHIELKLIADAALVEKKLLFFYLIN